MEKVWFQQGKPEFSQFISSLNDALLDQIAVFVDIDQQLMLNLEKSIADVSFRQLNILHKQSIQKAEELQIVQFQVNAKDQGISELKQKIAYCEEELDISHKKTYVTQQQLENALQRISQLSIENKSLKGTLNPHQLDQIQYFQQETTSLLKQIKQLQNQNGYLRKQNEQLILNEEYSQKIYSGLVQRLSQAEESNEQLKIKHRHEIQRVLADNEKRQILLDSERTTQIHILEKKLQQFTNKQQDQEPVQMIEFTHLIMESKQAVNKIVNQKQSLKAELVSIKQSHSKQIADLKQLQQDQAGPEISQLKVYLTNQKNLNQSLQIRLHEISSVNQNLNQRIVILTNALKTGVDAEKIKGLLEDRMVEYQLIAQQLEGVSKLLQSERNQHNQLKLDYQQLENEFNSLNKEYEREILQFEKMSRSFQNQNIFLQGEVKSLRIKTEQTEKSRTEIERNFQEAINKLMLLAAEIDKLNIVLKLLSDFYNIVDSIGIDFGSKNSEIQRLNDALSRIESKQNLVIEQVYSDLQRKDIQRKINQNEHMKKTIQRLEKELGRYKNTIQMKQQPLITQIRKKQIQIGQDDNRNGKSEQSIIDPINKKKINQKQSKDNKIQIDTHRGKDLMLKQDFEKKDVPKDKIDTHRSKDLKQEFEQKDIPRDIIDTHIGKDLNQDFELGDKIDTHRGKDLMLKQDFEKKDVPKDKIDTHRSKDSKQEFEQKDIPRDIIDTHIGKDLNQDFELGDKIDTHRGKDLMLKQDFEKKDVPKDKIDTHRSKDSKQEFEQKDIPRDIIDTHIGNDLKQDFELGDKIDTHRSKDLKQDFEQKDVPRDKIDTHRSKDLKYEPGDKIDMHRGKDLKQDILKDFEQKDMPRDQIYTNRSKDLKQDFELGDKIDTHRGKDLKQDFEQKDVPRYKIDTHRSKDLKYEPGDKIDTGQRDKDLILKQDFEKNDVSKEIDTLRGKDFKYEPGDNIDTHRGKDLKYDILKDNLKGFEQKDLHMHKIEMQKDNKQRDSFWKDFEQNDENQSKDSQKDSKDQPKNIQKDDQKRLQFKTGSQRKYNFHIDKAIKEQMDIHEQDEQHKDSCPIPGIKLPRGTKQFKNRQKIFNKRASVSGHQLKGLIQARGLNQFRKRDRWSQTDDRHRHLVEYGVQAEESDSEKEDSPIEQLDKLLMQGHKHVKKLLKQDSDIIEQMKGTCKRRQSLKTIISVDQLTKNLHLVDSELSDHQKPHEQEGILLKEMDQDEKERARKVQQIRLRNNNKKHTLHKLLKKTKPILSISNQYELSLDQRQTTLTAHPILSISLSLSKEKKYRCFNLMPVTVQSGIKSPNRIQNKISKQYSWTLKKDQPKLLSVKKSYHQYAFTIAPNYQRNHVKHLQEQLDYLSKLVEQKLQIIQEKDRQLARHSSLKDQMEDIPRSETQRFPVNRKLKTVNLRDESNKTVEEGDLKNIDNQRVQKNSSRTNKSVQEKEDKVKQQSVEIQTQNQKKFTSQLQQSNVKQITLETQTQKQKQCSKCQHLTKQNKKKCTFNDQLKQQLQAQSNLIVKNNLQIKQFKALILQLINQTIGQKSPLTILDGLSNKVLSDSLKQIAQQFNHRQLQGYKKEAQIGQSQSPEFQNPIIKITKILKPSYNQQKYKEKPIFQVHDCSERQSINPQNVHTEIHPNSHNRFLPRTIQNHCQPDLTKQASKQKLHQSSQSKAHLRPSTQSRIYHQDSANVSNSQLLKASHSHELQSIKETPEPHRYYDYSSRYHQQQSNLSNPVKQNFRHHSISHQQPNMPLPTPVRPIYQEPNRQFSPGRIRIEPCQMPPAHLLSRKVNRSADGRGKSPWRLRNQFQDSRRKSRSRTKSIHRSRCEDREMGSCKKAVNRLYDIIAYQKGEMQRMAHQLTRKASEPIQCRKCMLVFRNSSF